MLASHRTSRGSRSAPRTTRLAALRHRLAGLAVLLVAALIGSVAIATPAQAVTVYELEGEWDDDTPDVVQTGDSVAGTWWANVNDDSEAPGNEPVDNVTITVTAVGAVFEEIPPVCLTEGVDPPSEILDDGATLVCNGGTFDEGTAFRLDTAVTVTAVDGESVSLSATVADQAAELPEIPVENPFVMDIVWDENSGAASNNGDSRDMTFNWTLIHGAFSPDGQDPITYTLDVSNSVGGPMQIGPEACSAFETGTATGHPWSGGDHPADQMAPFVDDCTLTQINGTTFELTLSGIDYSHAQVPTNDSTGNTLPHARVAVASGQVQFRVITDENSGQVTVESSAPTYTSVNGALAEDDGTNNSSTNNWISGVHYGGWSPNYTGSSASSWADTYRVSPGTEVRASVSMNYRNVDEVATVGGMCVILDSEYVDFTSVDVVDVNNGFTEVDVPVEYLVAAAPYADPNAIEPCGNESLNWVSTPPADLTTVRAVRTQYDIADVGTDSRPALRVYQTIDSDIDPGQDVWMWSAYRGTGSGAPWTYPNRSNDPDDVSNEGVSTADARYPFTGPHRDVLRISTVSPAVSKSVDPATVDPGDSATFTVTYAAEGVGDLSPTVDGYEIVDTLPEGMTYVAGSSSTGSDPEIEGSTLTWTIDGVPTNEDQTLTYEVDVAEDVDPGARLVNSVDGSVGGLETEEPATAAVTVNAAGSTSILKTADQAFIPNVNGDGVGEGSWTVDVVSEDSSAQVFTDTIDILPYAGDGRGTDMTGTYELSGDVTVSMGATVYYTTADPATLSDDPADPMNGASGDTTGNTVGWTTTFDPDATAVRVITDELEPRGAFNFTIPIVTDGMDSADVLVNRAQGRAENTRLVMRTSAETQIATYYSANLKKYVQDSEGEWQDAQEPGTGPEFHIGDTVPYQIVVENTGQGTLTNIEVTDDLYPELGSFTIDVLEPGESYVHGFEIVLTEPVGEDDVVNTACAESDIPEDSVDENGDPLPPEINCDPARFTPVGDTTHTKELVSAAPIGGGQWEIVYEIVVESVQTPAAEYALADELHFTDQATITSAEVTASPGDVTLTDPAWDGQGNLMVTDFAEIEGMDNPDYEPHVYQVTVVADVPLQLEGAGGADDPTACGAEDGEPEDRAFTNTSELTKSNGETEQDEACAELPSIDVTKSITDGPVPNGDGTWTVSYDLVASNDGAAEGEYDLSDAMTAAGDLEVVDTSLTGWPEGVTPDELWTGLGAEGSPENVIVRGETLAGGSQHSYQVEVVLGMAEDAAYPPDVSACPDEPGGEGGGLANTVEIDHNDLTDTDEECTSVAAIVVDKSISDGPVPNGDGTFTITYDLVAENVGGAAGEYEVTDRLQYGEGIEIVEAGIVTAPEGVETNGEWTGLGAEDAAVNSVASGVSLDAGTTHTYQVEVLVQLDEDTIDPSVLQCPEPGSGESGGLANSTELEHNGITDSDDVCASLPLIDIAKSIADGPVPNGDGTWTISYELVAMNSGGAEGDYDLADRLLYGEGVVVESAAVVTAPDGVETEAGWTGQGDEGAAENVIASGVTLPAESDHTYEVDVVVSLDRETVTPEALECPEPGSGESGGLANSTELTHNGENRDDDVCAPLPLIDITKSLVGAVMPVEGEDGVYDATYELLVTNEGAGDGAYDLTDTLSAGEGIEVIGVQDVTTDAPDAVLNDGFDGIEDVTIVTDQPIAGADGAAVEHRYEVVVRYSADLFGVEVPTDDVCSTADGGPVPGALANEASVDWNGITEDDEECLRAGKPTIDKELTSAAPVGDGQWEVVYDITVGNVGDQGTFYDLDDELHFAEDVTVTDVGVVGPEGVAVSDTFDGMEDTRISTDVPIIGLDDEAYAPHVYTVNVLADVPLQVGPGEADGTGAPDCTEPAGGNTLEQGLNNAATLTDENGNETTDTDCGPLPSISIDKQLVGEPTQGSGGTWTVEYEITATNDGAAEGEYTLTDRLRFGAGLDITSAAVTVTPDGVTAASGWTGQGGEGDPANVVATDVLLGAEQAHTYQVRVTANLDEDQADESTFACPAPGSGEPGGFANTAGVDHNGLTGQADACATPDEPEDPTPAGPGSLPVTGATIGWLSAAAVLLLLLGAAVVLTTRHRRLHQ
ncbi:hypothetical protein UQW22_09345 [Isoptericola halotolerans]|uniref:DUF7507 domain-containing protein n=1 Tax=Isoptericola halotolerans TaxID=300560 RepID=UPI003890A14B